MKEQKFFLTAKGVCLIALVLLLAGTQITQAQPGEGQIWDKHEGNPVMDLIGEPGSWNDTYLGMINSAGHAMWDGEIYRFYATGYDGANLGIGLWTSSDLETGWEEYEGNPIITGRAGAVVIMDGDTLKMWYSGLNPIAIGYATSTDGINWTEYEGNPVLERSAPWETYGVYAPYVLKNENTYEMWYSSGIVTPWTQQIGYASSEDGINWTKSEDNPVLSPGVAGSWDEEGCNHPTVLFIEGEYLMWFLGFNHDPWPWQTGFATSDDGINWTKDTNNPVLTVGANGEWDDSAVFPKDLFQVDTTWQMCYVGLDGQSVRLGVATLTGHDAVPENFSDVPTEFTLHQNYPNPFNPTTVNLVSLPQTSMLRVSVYNILGEQIDVLANGQFTAGNHSLTFDGTGLPSGIYFIHAEVQGKMNEMRKVVLIK